MINPSLSSNIVNRTSSIFIHAPDVSMHLQRLIRGAAQYFREQTPQCQVRWGTLPFEESRLESALNKVDGIISFALLPANLLQLERSHIPLVNVSSRNFPAARISVIPDDELIGRMAADHFNEALYRNFAFVGASTHNFAQTRAAAFKASINSEQYSELWIDDKAPTHSYHQTNERIVRFIQSLPPNTALLAANDVFARRVCELALESGIAVPTQLAILGVDAEEMISLSSPISLSSVDIDSYTIGYQAGKALHREMTQPAGTRSLLKIPPKGVISGTSTDHLATDDEVVAKVVQMIRLNACNGLNVLDLASHLGISRRVLERRFRKATAKSLNEQITKVRMERAAELLEKSQLSISQIAEQCGFSSVYYFSRAFKQSTGRSPKVFRISC